LGTGDDALFGPTFTAYEYALQQLRKKKDDRYGIEEEMEDHVTVSDFK
jgi:hypothetical protein